MCCMQHRVGCCWSSPRVKLQPPQWGCSNLCPLNSKRKFKRPRSGSHSPGTRICNKTIKARSCLTPPSPGHLAHGVTLPPPCSTISPVLKSPCISLQLVWGLLICRSPQHPQANAVACIGPVSIPPTQTCLTALLQHYWTNRSGFCRPSTRI